MGSPLGQKKVAGRSVRSLGAPAPAILAAETSIASVVEENEVLRSAVAKRLRTAGFEVLEAVNCADGELVLTSVLVDASFLSLGS
jgi:hypothetical protein